MGNLHINIRSIAAFFLLLILIYPPKASASGKLDSTGRIDVELADSTAAGDSVIARVGDKKITVREFLNSYEFGPSFAKRDKNSKQVYLKYMINEKLLALDGYARGFADSSRVKDFLSAIKGDLSTEQLFRQDILPHIKVTTKEIDKAIKEKGISYNINWLYAPDKDSLEYFASRLSKGVSFDSLFDLQLNDSTFKDERSMNMDKFKLRTKSPIVALVIDSLKVGQVSKAVKAPDGYYIFKLVDEWKNVITTETQRNKEAYDAEMVLKQGKMDMLSGRYVKKIMIDHKPVIQARGFDITRSYMGNFTLSEKVYKDWNLDKRIDREKSHFDSAGVKNIGSIPLVKLSNATLTIDDFISWYKMRDEYLKFNKTSFNGYSASLENMIWQMVRDHLLIKRAYDRGLQNTPKVKEQTNWWRDKIVYAVVRDDLANSVGLNIELPSVNKTKNGDKRQELIEKMFRKLQELKKNYKVVVNEKILKRVEVKTSDNPRAVDFYIVKKGGTFPHPAYPSIDMTWEKWQ